VVILGPIRAPLLEADVAEWTLGGLSYLPNCLNRWPGLRTKAVIILGPIRAPLLEADVAEWTLRGFSYLPNCLNRWPGLRTKAVVILAPIRAPLLKPDIAERALGASGLCVNWKRWRCHQAKRQRRPDNGESFHWFSSGFPHRPLDGTPAADKKISQFGRGKCIRIICDF
jgi:hypothetical protein